MSERCKLISPRLHLATTASAQILNATSCCSVFDEQATTAHNILQDAAKTRSTVSSVRCIASQKIAKSGNWELTSSAKGATSNSSLNLALVDGEVTFENTPFSFTMICRKYSVKSVRTITQHVMVIWHGSAGKLSAFRLALRMRLQIKRHRLY